MSITINSPPIGESQSQPLSHIDKRSDKEEKDCDDEIDLNDSAFLSKIAEASNNNTTDPIMYKGQEVIVPNWHKLKPNKLSKTELHALFNEVAKERVILTGTSRDSPNDQFIKLKNLFQQATESPIKSKHRTLSQLKSEFTKNVSEKNWLCFSKKYMKNYKPELFKIDQLRIISSPIPKTFQYLNGKQSTEGLHQSPIKQSGKQANSDNFNKRSADNNDHNKNKKVRKTTIIIDSDEEMSEDDDLKIIPKDPKKQVFPYKKSEYVDSQNPAKLNKYTQIWLRHVNFFINEYGNEKQIKSTSDLNMKKSNTIHQLIKYLAYHHMVITDTVIDKIAEFFSGDYPITKIIENINNLWQTTYKDFISEKIINKNGERIKPFKWTLTIPRKTSKRSIISVFADPEQYEKRKKKKRRSSDSPYSEDDTMTPYDSNFYQNNYNDTHPDKLDIVKNLRQELDSIRKMQNILNQKIRKETNANQLSIREMLETPKRGLASVGIDKERGKEFAARISDLIDDDGSSFKLKAVVDAMNSSSNAQIAKSLQSMFLSKSVLTIYVLFLITFKFIIIQH